MYRWTSSVVDVDEFSMTCNRGDSDMSVFFIPVTAKPKPHCGFCWSDSGGG